MIVTMLQVTLQFQFALKISVSKPLSSEKLYFWHIKIYLSLYFEITNIQETSNYHETYISVVNIILNTFENIISQKSF